jgi:hypothetical protein
MMPENVYLLQINYKSLFNKNQLGVFFDKTLYYKKFAEKVIGYKISIIMGSGFIQLKPQLDQKITESNSETTPFEEFEQTASDNLCYLSDDEFSYSFGSSHKYASTIILKIEKQEYLMSYDDVKIVSENIIDFCSHLENNENHKWYLYRMQFRDYKYSDVLNTLTSKEELSEQINNLLELCIKYCGIRDDRFDNTFLDVEFYFSSSPKEIIYSKNRKHIKNKITESNSAELFKERIDDILCNIIDDGYYYRRDPGSNSKDVIEITYGEKRRGENAKAISIRDITPHIKELYSQMKPDYKVTGLTLLNINGSVVYNASDELTGKFSKSIVDLDNKEYDIEKAIEFSLARYRKERDDLKPGEKIPVTTVQSWNLQIGYIYISFRQTNIMEYNHWKWDIQNLFGISEGEIEDIFSNMTESQDNLSCNIEVDRGISDGYGKVDRIIVSIEHKMWKEDSQKGKVINCSDFGKYLPQIEDALNSYGLEILYVSEASDRTIGMTIMIKRISDYVDPNQICKTPNTPSRYYNQEASAFESIFKSPFKRKIEYPVTIDLIRDLLDSDFEDWDLVTPGISIKNVSSTFKISKHTIVTDGKSPSSEKVDWYGHRKYIVANGLLPDKDRYRYIHNKYVKGHYIDGVILQCNEFLGSGMQYFYFSTIFDRINKKRLKDFGIKCQLNMFRDHKPDSIIFYN